MPWRQHAVTGKQASKTCQGGHRGEGKKRKEILFTRRKAIRLVQFFPSSSSMLASSQYFWGPVFEVPETPPLGTKGSIIPCSTAGPGEVTA